ncbi:MAG: UDP-N-acetylglucosamine 2-epimerase (non-hydrolyzing) [Myxococcales bacterium]|nr:UDP-N-acetylglucosamine 2-epimerase (non-hydrolyzing) [Myxococcales bacterium]
MLARLAREHPGVRATICLTGQHQRMVQPMVELFGLQPEVRLTVLEPGQSLSTLAARLVQGIGEVIEQARPDWVVVQGDTTTALAGALAGSYQRCAVAHVEAGLRTGTLHAPWPEELNRRLISRVADLHLAPTPRARQALLSEGVPEQAVHLTGNTGVDALRWMERQLDEDPSLAPRLEARFDFLDPSRRLVLVTGHRRESFGAPLEGICRSLLQVLRARPDTEILWPVHLNPAVREPVARILGAQTALRSRIHLLSPVDYPALVYLLRRCTLVLTDSGGIQEEAPSVGRAVLVTRTVTERPEAVQAGFATLVGHEPATVTREVLTLLDDPVRCAPQAARDLFGDGHASARILDHLATSDLTRT